MKAARIEAAASDWPGRLRTMRQRLANRPSLLPHHFLEVVLPKIGGALFALRPGRASASTRLCGYAFLLPRAITPSGAVYTLRFEPLANAPVASADEISLAVQKELGPGDRTVFYRPDAAQRYTPTHIDFEGVDCGRPDATEAIAIRQLQRAIWHSSSDALYPSDLHSDDAGLGTSLVARVEGELVGFLLGFYHFGKKHLAAPWHKFRQDLRLESQILAVAPGQRRRRIGQLLKGLQARQALACGIDLISWTADPLLFPNALLNFTRLRAVTHEFQPSLYPFHNELNQVPASRLSLLWPIRARRVQTTLTGDNRADPIAVSAGPDVTVVNRADGRPVFDAATARIAIEIPADWIALQRADRTTAQRWRDVTNRLLGHYLGPESGRYILTNAGVSGSRHFLIGEQVDDRMLERLAEFE